MTNRPMGKGGRRGAEAPAGYANLQGVGRAMAVLEELAERPMRAKELTDVLGIKWTTAYRTIAYLHDNGFLERDEATDRYYIGARLYYIGSSYVNNLPILASSDPYVRAAAEETGATAQLVQRYGKRSMVLAVAEPASGAHIPKTTIGWHFPLHCGAKSQVLLAYEEPSFIEEYLRGPLEALTRYTITDPDVLRARLEEIRSHGYAITHRDVQLSTGAVAFPVADSGGNVVASLTLIVNHSELGEREAELVDVCSRTAQSISTSLGWRPDLGLRARDDAGSRAKRAGGEHPPTAAASPTRKMPERSPEG